LHSFIVGNEDDFIGRFWRGLNHEIQDLIMHKELYSVDHLYRLACNTEQKIQKRFHKTDKCTINSPSSASTKFPSSVIAPTLVATPVCEEVTACDGLAPMVPSWFRMEFQGNNKGIIVGPSHEIDIFLAELNTSCVEFPALLTPSILEVNPTDLNAPCDPIPEIISVLSAPTESTAAYIQPCDLIAESDLDRIKLLIHDTN
jgi:hypothetical protein